MKFKGHPFLSIFRKGEVLYFTRRPILFAISRRYVQIMTFQLIAKKRAQIKHDVQLRLIWDYTVVKVVFYSILSHNLGRSSGHHR